MNKKSAHAGDLRKGRFSESNRIYHITTTTYERVSWFQDFHCARILISAMHNEHRWAQTIAFTVMPDHFHWLVQLSDGGRLNSVIRNIKSASSRQINKYYGRSGSIWQAGYYDHAVRKDEDVQSIARYIVANPLRAGLVDRIGDYPFWDAVWL